MNAHFEVWPSNKLGIFIAHTNIKIYLLWVCTTVNPTVGAQCQLISVAYLLHINSHDRDLLCDFK